MKQQPPAIAPRTQLKWAAVDLDGTLARGIWTPHNPTSEIGPPIWENVDKLLIQVRHGRKIWIHTSRGWTDYERIEHWLRYWGIPFDGIICGKLLADVYIDDRAVNASAEKWEV